MLYHCMSLRRYCYTCDPFWHPRMESIFSVGLSGTVPSSSTLMRTITLCCIFGGWRYGLMQLADFSTCGLRAASWYLIMVADSFIMAETAPADKSDAPFGYVRSIFSINLGTPIHWIYVIPSHSKVTSSSRVTIVGNFMSSSRWWQAHKKYRTEL